MAHGGRRRCRACSRREAATGRWGAAVWCGGGQQRCRRRAASRWGAAGGLAAASRRSRQALGRGAAERRRTGARPRRGRRRRGRQATRCSADLHISIYYPHLFLYADSWNLEDQTIWHARISSTSWTCTGAKQISQASVCFLHQQGWRQKWQHQADASRPGVAVTVGKKIQGGARTAKNRCDCEEKKASVRQAELGLQKSISNRF
ncbi:uncharacterized protein LOC127772484 [Oryza glaberrima]|uniref:uncharacterized protein LOC127772484 n=1 Tax=Oryza glaberrima TaxID=4538 RepID=UPI00224C578A|nr:uncharacterized protein LOC127772484 [Oryza glaberrima]